MIKEEYKVHKLYNLDDHVKVGTMREGRGVTTFNFLVTDLGLGKTQGRWKSLSQKE